MSEYNEPRDGRPDLMGEVSSRLDFGDDEWLSRGEVRRRLREIVDSLRDVDPARSAALSLLVSRWPTTLRDMVSGKRVREWLEEQRDVLDDPGPGVFLLWLDLETSGLDPERDRLLQVAACITTATLEPVPGWFDRVVFHDSEDAARMRRDAAPVVQAMHDRTG